MYRIVFNMSSPTKPLHHHLVDYFLPHSRNEHRPHIFSLTSVAVLAIMVIVFEAGYIFQTKIVFLTTDFLASVLPSVLTDLTNVARAENGLPTVTRNAVLDAAAQAAAEDMAAKGYFSHKTLDGKEPWYWLDQAGYAYSYAGQNLAVNFTDSENVQTAWLASPTHRENIMKPQYTEVGFGTANGYYQGYETTFVVEFFATPRAVAAAVTPVAAKPVAVATTPAPTFASESVLGTGVKPATSSADRGVAPTAPVEASSKIPSPEVKKVDSLLASPLSTLETILTILLGVIASAFGFAVLMRGKLQHPSVVYAGSFLMLLISATMLASAMLSGPVILSDTAAQMASVEAAF